MFKIEINCDNDAFCVDLGGSIAEILREVADNVSGLKPCKVLESTLFDPSGNAVGFAKFEETQEP